MKKLLSFLSICFLLTGFSTAFADDFKVGVVDVQKVLQNYSKVAQVEEKLKQQFGPEQGKLQAKNKQISEEIAKFNR
ncbi:unnamed protein product, partial [marine sediment metagenome]